MNKRNNIQRDWYNSHADKPYIVVIDSYFVLVGSGVWNGLRLKLVIHLTYKPLYPFSTPATTPFSQPSTVPRTFTPLSQITDSGTPCVLWQWQHALTVTASFLFFSTWHSFGVGMETIRVIGGVVSGDIGLSMREGWKDQPLLWG